MSRRSVVATWDEMMKLPVCLLWRQTVEEKFTCVCLLRLRSHLLIAPEPMFPLRCVLSVRYLALHHVCVCRGCRCLHFTSVHQFTHLCVGVCVGVCRRPCGVYRNERPSRLRFHFQLLGWWNSLIPTWSNRNQTTQTFSNQVLFREGLAHRSPNGQKEEVLFREAAGTLLHYMLYYVIV